jgi:hypothetical protein
MAIQEIKPFYYDENGMLHINACCSEANSDPIRAARLARKAKAGEKAAALELEAMKAGKMFEEIG